MPRSGTCAAECLCCACSNPSPIGDTEISLLPLCRRAREIYLPRPWPRAQRDRDSDLGPRTSDLRPLTPDFRPQTLASDLPEFVVLMPEVWFYCSCVASW